MSRGLPVYILVVAKICRLWRMCAYLFLDPCKYTSRVKSRWLFVGVQQRVWEVVIANRKKHDCLANWSKCSLGMTGACLTEFHASTGSGTKLLEHLLWLPLIVETPKSFVRTSVHCIHEKSMLLERYR